MFHRFSPKKYGVSDSTGPGDTGTFANSGIATGIRSWQPLLVPPCSDIRTVGPALLPGVTHSTIRLVPRHSPVGVQVGWVSFPFFRSPLRSRAGGWRRALQRFVVIVWARHGPWAPQWGVWASLFRNINTESESHWCSHLCAWKLPEP